MDREKINKMRACSRLMPDPGGEVVRECLDEIERLSGLLIRADDEIHDMTQLDCPEYVERDEGLMAEIRAATDNPRWPAP